MAQDFDAEELDLLDSLVETQEGTTESGEIYEHF